MNRDAVRVLLTTAAISLLLGCCTSCSSKKVQGQVVDNDSGAGIKGVTVKAIQRGWGRSGGSLVWDKDYIYETQTDQNGWFTLSYSEGGNSVHLQFTKDGYHSTKQGYPLQDTYVYYWETPIIRLAKNGDEKTGWRKHVGLD